MITSMALSCMQVLLMVGMLVTGSINTLSKKAQNDCTVSGYPDKSANNTTKPHPFNHPWFQTWIMFIGETICLLGYCIVRKRERDKWKEEHGPIINEENKLHQTRIIQLIIACPTICDLIGTSLAGIGLVYVDASVWQMLRGSIIIFAGILSKIFLKRNLKCMHWTGMSVTMIGLILVGCSSIFNAEHSSSASETLFGIALILGGQLVSASQMIIEELFLKKRSYHPLHVVGMEGTYGFFMMTLDSGMQKRMSPDERAKKYLNYNIDPKGFIVKYINDMKGYGIFTTTTFQKQDFLVEYVGELLSSEKAAANREKKYEKRNRNSKFPRCYMYYFKHNQKTMCIDATETAERLGNLVNDCVTPDKANAKMKKLIVNGKPHLVLFASRDISIDEEILYDYGEDDLWWRKELQTENVNKDSKEEAAGTTTQTDSVDKAVIHKDCDDEPFIDSKEAAATTTQRPSVDKAMTHKVCDKEPFIDGKEEAAGTTTQTDSVDKAMNKEAAATTTRTGSVDKAMNKEAAATTTRTGSVDKAMSKEAAATTTRTGSVNKAMSKEAEATTTQTGSVNKAMSKEAAATTTQTGSVNKAMSKEAAATTTRTGSVDKAMNKEAAATTTRTGSVDKAMSKEAAATTTQTGSVDKAASKEEAAATTTQKDSVDKAVKHKDCDKEPFIGFSCSYCGLCYRRRCNLERHKETCHITVEENDMFDDASDEDDDMIDIDYVPESDHSSDFEYSELVPEDSLCLLSEENTKTLKRNHTELKEETPDFTEENIGIVNDSSDQCDIVTSSTEKFQDITLSSVTSCSNEGSTRIWDKKNYCLFCGKKQSKMIRHLQRKHGDEFKIKKLLSYKTGSEKRKLEAKRLRHLGNFYHNAKVLETGEGDFIVAKRPIKGQQIPISHFVPCTYCKGYYIITELWRHVKTCELRKDEEDNEHFRLFVGGTVREGRKVMEACLNPEIDENTKELLFSCMKKDVISLVCKQDDIIRMFGSNLLKKNGKDHSQYIRTRMRELARLVLKVREQDQNSLYLKDMLKPSMFDKVICAIRQECQISEKVTEFATPSLALKLGHSLKRCAELQMGISIKEQNNQGEKDASNFLKLCEMEYCDKVSSMALDILNTRKQCKPTVLPFTEDIVTFQSYIQKQASSLVKVKGEEQSECFRELAEVTLSYLISFNKRRSGEMSKMLITDYTEIPHNVDAHDLQGMLSAAEQRLCSRLMLLHIRGKRGRRVPVILPPEVQKAIPILIDQEVRKHAGVHPENQYVFALQRGSLNNIRGWDALQETVAVAKLEHPETFKSTLLRKYVATVSQVLNMDENEMDWLASHLGHDIKVHRKFYRMKEDHVELAKVSKLLLAIDRGQIHKYAGKKLNDIDLGEMDELHIEEEEEEEEGEDDKIEAQKVCEQGPSTTGGKVTKSKTKGKQCVHKPWLPKQKKYIIEKFHDAFIKMSMEGIGKAKCEKAIAEAGDLLIGRTWIQVKSCFKNIIDRRRKDQQREMCSLKSSCKIKQ